jgi:hypothetical protein
MTRFLPTLKSSTWILILGLFVGIGILLWPNLAFASGLVESVGNGIEAILFFMVANLTGWLLWMGGSLLDYGLNTFVINFGTIFQTGGVGVAVDQLWAMVRDLFNILFIFGLVYIGFKMILNSDDSQTKKTLISLIIAALLMNFSLFITKFVVDFTNILAAEIATAGFETVESGLEGSEKNVRVGDTFFGLMGIGPLVLEMPKNIGTGEQAAWSYIFGIGIINIVGAFAFGVGGIMLIIRFIALSVYMVLSPFMFLGMIFPGFQAMSSKYWSGFLKQAFYAPVYVVMIFFSATILNNLFRLETATQTGGSAQGAGIGDVVRSNSSIFSPTAGSVSTIAENFAGGIGPFILSVGFLIAAVQVAGKLSSDGSGIMAKVGGAVNSRVRGAVRGGGRFAARNTLGYGAMVAGAGADGIANSRAYRRLNTGLGNNRFTRNIAAGMDATLAAGGRTSIAGSRTAAEQREVVRARQNQVNSQQDVTGREDAIAAYRKNDTAENRAKAAGAVAKMSDAELLNLSDKDLQDPKILANLSEVQIKTLKDSGNFTNDAIKAIKSDRETAVFNPLEEALNKTGATADELNTAMEDLAKTVKNLSTEQLEAMDPERINSQSVASQLSDKQLEALRDSGKIPADRLEGIKKTRSEGLVSIANTGGIKGQQIPTGAEGKKFVQKQHENLFKGSAQDVGKLPPEVFMNQNMVSYITPSALQQRIRNGLTEDQRSVIEKEIRQHITTGTKEGDRAKKTWQKWSNSTTEGASFDFTSNII